MLDLLDEDEAEHVLLVVREVLLYKLPPRPAASGYRCQDWPKESFLFQGRLRVTAVGPRCAVLFESADTGELFAQVPLDNERPEVSVEPVTDSSRYFAVRVDDGNGRHAFLGLGFRERSDAFDFNIALQDHVKQARAGRMGGPAADGDAAAAPPLDLSLKAGETLRVNLSGVGGGARRREPANAGGGGPGGLPPPPALSAPPGANSGARRRPAPGASAPLLGSDASDAPGGGGSGGLGDGASFGGAGQDGGPAGPSGGEAAAGDGVGGWATFG